MSGSFLVIKNHRNIIARESRRAEAVVVAKQELQKHPGATYEVAKVSKRVWTEVVPATRIDREEDVNGGS